MQCTHYHLSGPQDFPDITICPFPSWNQPELIKLGYGQSFKYSKGLLDGSNLIGWSGNVTGSSPETVIDKVSTIQNQTECPITSVLMRSNGKEKFVQLHFQLTSLFHPSGRCCKVDMENMLTCMSQTLTYFRQLFQMKQQV